MTVPGRIEAASLLCSLDPPDWLVRHSRAVAEVAGFVAARVAERGIAVDRRLAESAALLHDVDKVLPPDDPRRSLPHGQGSAAWLTDHGHAELADAVATHPVTRVVDMDWFDAWLASAATEDRIVAYADRRASQRLETLDERFASQVHRHPGVWDKRTVRRVREAVGRLETDVCALAGIAPEDVRRLRWTAAALRTVPPPA